MQRPLVPAPDVLSYSQLRRGPRWKAYLCGVAALPVLYVLSYIMLRACGVFYPFYNQGGREMDGGTGIYAVDVVFFPAAMTAECVQDRMKWLPEPTGE